jgi:hypothetical protein
MKLGQKGVFITLTALMLAGMLLLSASNLQKIRSIEESAVTISIASQKIWFLEKNIEDAAKSAYSSAGINWKTLDNNALLYTESFPNLSVKQKILPNLSKISAFYHKEFQNTGLYSPASVDTGKIVVYGKDLNITHSNTSGFGSGKEIHFIYSERKFNQIQFDINAQTPNIALLSQTSTLCGACTNPLRLTINLRNQAGTLVYSFDNNINAQNSAEFDFNTSIGIVDLNLSYAPNTIDYTSNTTNTDLGATIIFNDPLFEPNIDKTSISITELSSFGARIG